MRIHWLRTGRIGLSPLGTQASALLLATVFVTACSDSKEPSVNDGGRGGTNGRSGAGGASPGRAGTTNATGGTDSSAGGASFGHWGDGMLMEAGEGEPFDPRVALDAAGNAWVTWTQNDGDRVEVRSRRYDATAEEWRPEEVIDGGFGTAIQVSYVPPGGNDSPGGLRVNRDGVAIATWLDAPPNCGTAQALCRAKPRASIYIPGTNTWVADDLHSEGTLAVRAAVGDDGTAVAVFAVEGVQVRTYREGAWGPETTIDTDQSAMPADVVVGADGTATAVWITENGLRAARGRADQWSDPISVSAEPTPVTEPQLALLPDGVLAIWIQDDGISSSVFYSVYETASDTWTAADKVERLPGSAHTPALAVNATGVAALAWEIGVLGGAPSTSTETFTSVYTPGSGWGSPVKIADIDRAPRPGVDASGNLMVVLGSFNVLYTQSADGETWTEPTLLVPFSMADAARPQTPWELAVADDGRAIVVWKAMSTGHDLHAQLYEP